MDADLRLSIGALSEQTAVNIETIRFYERLGILPAPPIGVPAGTGSIITYTSGA